ncbi:hypothetical protein [Streptomyces cylindrosporus]|uniref:Uncharacterized protein n=1 Tax=Streptomyces cylindrosporus TaxID=2927583 RepID=A0ABS9YPJ0_9ACTN|nr:hypothetical protein [Streptomyces cylindrosporus]MCI3279137.1 hypothetical protein [Streptomyces cylindrosporus]
MADHTAIDRIPIGRSVTYAVRGAPEIGDEYNTARTIAPTEITLNYRAVADGQLGRVSVYVKGWWMQDGKRVPMDKPVGRWLYGDPDAWPKWLAEEARLHDPDTSTPPSADHAAIYLDEDGDPWIEYLTSPRSDHVVPLQIVSVEAVDRTELEGRIGPLTLIGWCKQ